MKHKTLWEKITNNHILSKIITFILIFVLTILIHSYLGNSDENDTSLINSSDDIVVFML